MRDILTVLAVGLILVLVAALVGPSFVDWASHRAAVETALTRAAGAPVRTRGAVSVRLLPSPRITLDRVEMAADGAQLAADKVAVELALAPLLRGDLRIVDATLTRPVLRAAWNGSGEVAGAFAPPRPPSDDAGSAGARVMVDKLTIVDGTVLVHDAAAQQERRLARVNAVLQGASLRGPWQVNGTVEGQPFRISTGEADGAGAMRLKAGFGNELTGRWEADGTLAFPRGPGTSPVGSVVPRFEGRLGYARLLAASGDGDAPLLTVSAAVTAAGREVRAEALEVEAGRNGRGIRLAGSATLDWAREPRADVALAARRISVEDVEHLAGTDAQALLPELAPPGLPVTVRISVGSIGWREEEASEVELVLRAAGGGFLIERAAARLPGEADLGFRGRLDPADEGRAARASGRLTFDVRAPRRLALALERLGAGPDVTGPLSRQPDLSLKGDVFVSPAQVAVSRLRLAAGRAALTGLARLTAADGAAAPRLDAQLGLDGFDLADLPGIAAADGLLDGTDVALVLDGRRIRYGDGADNGRVRAKLSRTGPAFAIEALDVTGFAGMRLAASGRIDGATAGRIEARVEAPRAAPALALLRKVLPADLPGAVLMASLVDGLPEPLQGQALRGRLVAEAGRGAGGRTVALDLDAALGDARLAGRLALGDAARVETATLTLDAPDAGPLLGGFGGLSAGAGARLGPLQVAFTLAQPGREGPALSVAGTVAGVRVRTPQPFRLESVEREPLRLSLASDDAGALARTFGLASATPLPLALDLTARPDDRAAQAWRVELKGTVAAQPVTGTLDLSQRRVRRAELALDDLSLPGLAALIALGPLPAAAPGALWPSGRFAAQVPPLGGFDLDLAVKRLDLGAGFVATQAGLAVRPVLDGVAFTLRPSAFADGTLAGHLTLKRLGAAASLAADLALDQVDIAALGAGEGLDGRLSGTLRLGGSGESPASIVANLAGGGTLKLLSLAVPRLDPAALGRVAQAARETTDALDAARLRSLLADAFAAGPLRAEALEVPVAISGGVVRAAPLALATPEARLQGALALDLRTLTLDASALVTANAAPPGWTGAPPQIALSLRGPLRNPRREIDAASLAAGLATLRLGRELERIETFEAQARQLRAERGHKEGEPPPATPSSVPLSPAQPSPSR